ncbi:putative pilus system protein FilF [Acinetobacter lanii]|uniref:Protein FilF n=1 Tax=Acinetobacter lanii TaxID=2715163 RepID=A0A6G8S6D7_9GAMM|nr:hypothetical protein [Acinetobacter lanii]QIO09671.1 hypothetical protein G8D99_12075 [Acinetobacter lanii]
MKNKILLPFALSSLVLALSGCGGESTSIKEDPYAGVKTSSNGCEASSEKCHAFVISYPVAGLNFDCSSDIKNHFVTELEGNTVTGGCAVGDKVSFYIQGESTSRKIELGQVDLAKIAPLRVSNQPVQISLLDIAKGMTGKDATEMNLNDATFKTMVALTRVFQAVGLTQDSNTETDLQPVDLYQQLKDKLSILPENVKANDFVDGSYANDMKAWLDVSSVSEQSAETLAKQQLNLKNVNVYSANFLAISALNVDVGGFHGVSQTKKESIANLYAITDRQGYSIGYAVQWRGVPLSVNNPISDIGRINLLTQAVPEKLNTVASGKAETSIQNWINPLTDRIQNPLILKKAIGSADQMNIFQGKLLNQKSIAGTEYMYKNLTGSTTAPSDSTVYGKWNQNIEGENFTGSIDVYKTNPATYLSNEIFRTVNTVKAGQNYIFPLYANLTFKFNDPSIPNQVVGIVIDEQGDIRTNRTNDNLASNQCNSVDANLVDTVTKAQQYRIGTTGAANSSANDKSITIRMILAHPIFGNLDGALIGLNESFMYLPQAPNGEIYASSSGGVRLNLQNLVVNNSTQNGINISSWSGDAANSANWINMHAVAQTIYEAANKDNANVSSSELVKRQGGTIEKIDLLPCYQIKQK